MSLAAGTKLGRYEIRAPIGAGGMGEVYLAHDPKIRRDVAIKVLPMAFCDDKDRVARFEQEAQAAGALNHPNILSIHDVDTHDGSTYVVSELLEGETLRDRMASGPLQTRKAIDYGLQIAHGLAAAHERGIVHRDLKPENIFITRHGQVKILDFGLAKLMEQTNGTEAQTDVLTRRVNTSPGAVMGTVGYMSPEQLRGQAVDYRSDIFSFGSILYEMLSGRRAFQRSSAADTISAILREDPPDLSTTNNQIAPPLDRTIRHCLEKNPEERFHSACDLAFALAALSNPPASEAVTEISSSIAATASTSTWGVKSVRWLPWLLAILGVTLAATFALFYFNRGSYVEARAVHTSILLGANSLNPLHAAISPDGHLLTFTAEAEGRRLLWVRPIDSAEAQSLTGTEGAGFPFWSADSRSIGFFAGGKLKRIEAAGGPILNLCDAPRGRGGTWNRNGVILFTPDTRDPVHQIQASGGVPEPITQIDSAKSELTHRWPHFLPDGKHFVYFGRSSGPAAATQTGIFVSSLDGKETKLVINNASNPVYAAPGYLLFVREGNLMAQPFDTAALQVTSDPIALARGVSYNRNWDVADFSASNDGVLIYRADDERPTQLVWLDRTGKQIDTVGELGHYSRVKLSPDGKRIAVFKNDPVRQEGDIWLLETDRGSATRFTFTPQPANGLVWSPDASRIVFGYGEGGISDLRQKPVSTAGTEEELLKSDYYKEPHDWSRDQRYLAFTVIDPKTGWDIWILPLFGDRKPFQFVSTPFNESQASFSPDGRWLAYRSNESGKNEIYVQAFPGPSAKQQVSIGGGAQPRWAAGGKELYYGSTDRKKLLVVQIKPGTSFESGETKTVFELPEINDYDIAADGRRFLVAIPVGEKQTPSITLVVNWTAGLKR